MSDNVYYDGQWHSIGGGGIDLEPLIPFSWENKVVVKPAPNQVINGVLGMKQLLYTSNGITWSSIPMSATPSGQALLASQCTLFKSENYTWMVGSNSTATLVGHKFINGTVFGTYTTPIGLSVDAANNRNFVDACVADSGVIIAVVKSTTGNDCNLVYSTDEGYTWTSTSSTTSSTLSASIASGGGVTVARMANVTRYSEDDGLSWSNLGTTLTVIKYFNGRFWGINNTADLFSSPTGLPGTWSTVLTHSGTIVDFCGNGLGGVIAISTVQASCSTDNGDTWITEGVGTNCRYATWVTGKWLVLRDASGTKYYVSEDDGVSWSEEDFGFTLTPYYVARLK